MKLSKTIDLIETTPNRQRLFIGWGIVIGLSLFELLAVLYGRPSALANYPVLTKFVSVIGEWVPLVQSFSRCAARFDAGSGLMLALNVVFFPIKLAALYYAHPKKLSNPDKGLRAIWGSFYMFLIALVATIPTYIWLLFAPGDSGLASINKKTSALCSGGLPAFMAEVVQGGFALLGAYVSLVIFIGIFRSLFMPSEKKS